MKRTILFSALAVILLAGCASYNNSMASSSAPGVTLRLAQMTGANDLYYFRGPVNIQYGLQVTNPTNMPVTLRNLRLDTIGGGAYRLHTGNSPFNVPIPANSSVTIPLSTWANAMGGFLRSTEPVNLRVVAQFDSPNGTFIRQGTEFIPQQ